jgi:hypothetical protein
MYFVIKPQASCSSLSKSPAAVFISDAESKFFASLLVAPIWHLETKSVWVSFSALISSPLLLKDLKRGKRDCGCFIVLFLWLFSY